MDFLIYSKNKKRFVVKNKNISANTEIGGIDRKILIKSKHGDIVNTSKDKKVLLLEPSFKDKYDSMTRGAQSIKLKDCAIILAETLIGKESVCLDCGAGMGGLTCFLAKYVKKVYSVDYVKKHLENSAKNAEFLGLKNIKFIEGNIYEKIPTKSKLDLITLDVINPENVIINAKKSLKKGGYLVAYCPQVTQLQVFANKAREEGFEFIKSVEVNQRTWKIEGKLCRPDHIGLMHTAFLCFARKIWN